MNSASIFCPAIWCRPAMSEAAKTPLTLREQSDFLTRLIARCLMRGGSIAAETTLVLTDEDCAHLDHLAMRLERMAPYQTRIEKLVRYGE